MLLLVVSIRSLEPGNSFGTLLSPGPKGHLDDVQCVIQGADARSKAQVPCFVAAPRSTLLHGYHEGTGHGPPLDHQLVELADVGAGLPTFQDDVMERVEARRLGERHRHDCQGSPDVANVGGVPGHEAGDAFDGFKDGLLADANPLQIPRPADQTRVVVGEPEDRRHRDERPRPVAEEVPQAATVGEAGDVEVVPANREHDSVVAGADKLEDEPLEGLPIDGLLVQDPNDRARAPNSVVAVLFRKVENVGHELFVVVCGHIEADQVVRLVPVPACSRSSNI